MKKLLKTLAAGMMAALLTFGFACGGGNNGDGDIPDQNVTLVVQSAAPIRETYRALLNSEKPGSTVYNQAMFSKVLLEGFKAKYPNVTVRFIEHGWGEALYQAQQLHIKANQGGTPMPYDIMIGETYMGYYAENGMFAELDSSKFTDVVGGTYQSMVKDGKMYGVSMCTGQMGLQYNTQILAEAGIPEDKWVPTTWNELLENCKAVSEYAKANNKKYNGIVMNCVGGESSVFRALPFLRQAGGDIMDANGNLTLNSPQNVEAFNYLRSLAKYAYADSINADEDTVQYYFADRGYGAYCIEGQFGMTNAGDHIKSAKLPTKEAGSVEGNVVTGNVMFGICHDSENKAVAQAFLEHLVSYDVQKALYEYDGRLPVNKELLASEEVKTLHPNLNSYIEQLNAGNVGRGSACFLTNSNDIWGIWGVFYKEVLTSDKDIAGLVSAAHSDIAKKMA